MLVITAAQTASVWNVGIKTAAAQNMVAIGFIEKQFQTSITWVEWFIAGAPFSALLSVAVYFIMTRMMKPEMAEIAGGRATIRQQLGAVGPMTRPKRAGAGVLQRPDEETARTAKAAPWSTTARLDKGLGSWASFFLVATPNR